MMLQMIVAITFLILFVVLPLAVMSEDTPADEFEDVRAALGRVTAATRDQQQEERGHG